MTIFLLRSVRAQLCAGAVLLLLGQTAQARVDTPPVAHSWTGFYLGGHVGGALGFIDTSLPLDQFGRSGSRPLTSSSAPGFMGGGQLGYDWQAGALVVGVEAAVGSVGIEGSTRCFGGVLTCKADSGWLATVTGRVGSAIGNNTLLYVLGGGARRAMEFSATGTILGFIPFNAEGSDTRNGWLVGAGGRYAFSKNWIGVIEYNYADFGDGVVALKLNPVFGPFRSMNVNVDDRVHLIKAGVNYQF